MSCGDGIYYMYVSSTHNGMHIAKIHNFIFMYSLSKKLVLKCTKSETDGEIRNKILYNW
jgi:NOL1/NOP2/fmu family ribosome biogenesis protein